MAIDRPETNAGAPPKGAGQHRRNFLGARGMAANPGSPCGLLHGVGPSGEESCDDAVAPKRSKRPALFFGQIRPLKRPFGAVETRGLNGDGGDLEVHRDQTGNHRQLYHPVFRAGRILLPGHVHPHHPNRVSCLTATLALTLCAPPVAVSGDQADLRTSTPRACRNPDEADR